MANKRILFRVDAGGKVGLGHYYRSINLALSLKEKGHEIVFAHLPSAFWHNLKDFPFKHHELSLECSEFEMVSICRNEAIDIFYVDGIISFTSHFVQEVKKTAKVVFYQNLSDSKALSDVFILPSIHQDETFFVPFQTSNTVVYKGLKYFTFNKEIEQCPSFGFTKNTSVKNVAVTAGGSDPRNVLLTLYEMLEEHTLRDIEFVFFYGNDYLYKDKIPVRLSKNVSFLLYDIRQIVSCDVIIAAFGVSAYEFMCLGKPVIGVGHQPANAEALKTVAQKTGAIYDMGLIDDLRKETFNATLNCLILDRNKLADMSQKAKKILDTEGIHRVVDILEKL